MTQASRQNWVDYLVLGLLLLLVVLLAESIILGYLHIYNAVVTNRPDSQLQLIDNQPTPNPIQE